MSSLSSLEWHKRYLQQALWTANLRDYLLKSANLADDCFVLDIGCGTGALFENIWRNQRWNLHGLDISYSSLEFSKEQGPDKVLLQGDGKTLPIQGDSYDLTFCHFVLLWVSEPEKVVKEMVRVTKPGGYVMAFAEPDYGGRIDYPSELAVLGKLQVRGLSEQGADPYIGRSLASIFHQSNLGSIQTGVLGGQWFGTPDWDAWEREWQVLESDLSYISQDISPETLVELKKADRQATSNGVRVLYIPTFYATGIVKRP